METKIQPEIVHDKIYSWSNKSKDIPFKSNKKCVGNGEEKLACELNITSPIGGQNSTVDLKHPNIGNISVKDMTHDDCTLGAECTQEMRKIFRKIVNLFVAWIEKYQQSCELAKKFHSSINKKNGSSILTILEGIDRCELSKTNLMELNKNLEELKKIKVDTKVIYDSLNSEYIDDIIYNMENKSLQEMLNDCIRKEAINMTLIIVYKDKGWIIIKDYSKLSCPRITRGSPRINYN
jgi:hypothetical protein